MQPSGGRSGPGEAVGTISGWTRSVRIALVSYKREHMTVHTRVENQRFIIYMHVKRSVAAVQRFQMIISNFVALQKCMCSEDKKIHVYIKILVCTLYVTPFFFIFFVSFSLAKIKASIYYFFSSSISILEGPRESFP